MSLNAGGVTLAFSSIGHVFSHLVILLYATLVLVLEREMGITFAEIQWLALPGFILYGVASLPAGWLGDRWSEARMMAVFFFGTGAAAIYTAFATTKVELLIGFSAIGLFGAIYHPVGMAWLVKNAVNRGRALGINGVFGSVGTAGAAVVAGSLADLWGWRAAYIVPGAVAIAVGFAFVACMASGVIRDRTSEARTVAPASVGDMKRVFAILVITTIAVGLIFQATSAALPKLFSDRLFAAEGSATRVGALVSVVYLLSAVAQWAGGELADRYPQRTVYFACQALQVPALLLAFALHSWLLVPVAVVMIGLNSALSPAENAIVARYTPLGWRSRVFGLKFVVSQGLASGGIALVAVVYDATGALDASFLIFAAFAAVAAVGALLLPTDSAAAVPAPRAAAAE